MVCWLLGHRPGQLRPKALVSLRYKYGLRVVRGVTGECTRCKRTVTLARPAVPWWERKGGARHKVRQFIRRVRG